jgi:PAS domain S-box-containing protein
MTAAAAPPQGGGRAVGDVHLQVRAVQAAADAVFCQDLHGTLLTWNPGAERLYGVPAADAIGQQHPEVLRDDEAGEQLATAHARAAAGASVDRFDSWHHSADGSRIPVSVSVVPLRDDTGRVDAVATTVADITVRTALAQELEDIRGQLQSNNDALRRSNRDLEQFAYVASHDLSEPLRVMTGYVNQLERRYDEVLDERGRRYMFHIVDASARMRALIDDLLDYSRFLRAPREVGPVDLGEVLVAVTASLADAVRKTEAVIDVGPLPAVRSDTKQLESLLQNLLSNALKFRNPDLAPRIAVSASETDGWVTLRVDDNGIGIPSEYRDRVFRMFQRLHVREAYPGTGIGLAIAQQIVELAGGRIWAEDSPLGGARLCCTLPSAPGDAA